MTVQFQMAVFVQAVVLLGLACFGACPTCSCIEALYSGMTSASFVSEVGGAGVKRMVWHSCSFAATSKPVPGPPCTYTCPTCCSEAFYSGERSASFMNKEGRASIGCIAGCSCMCLYSEHVHAARQLE